MKLAYLGSPQVAVNPLKALVADGHEVALVVSQPDRKRGRGGNLLPSPVKAAALELGLTVSDRVDDVIDVGAELGVVVAFGRLIKPHVLSALPMVNLHFSLLPRWRGAAPVERAILAGDTTTGVCLMALEEGLDTGPVYARAETPIDSEDTADQLRSRLEGLGTAMLLQALLEGLPEPEPQVGEPTYAAKLAPGEHELDWGRPAIHLHRVIRLGRAWTTFRGKRLKVLLARLVDGPVTLAPGAIDPVTLQVGAGEGAVELVEVQPEGKPVQEASAWRNGAHLIAGDRLG
ncbi:MAG TPA: methionyl-tRNA formyltransferase [Acidimicrobiales bacterium]|nr:methionyl-tRNA formyltransferase [Acidimicrobiales bacterium]